MEGPNRWERAQSLFDALVDLPHDQVVAQLTVLCPEDPDLAHFVAEMIAHDASDHRLSETVSAVLHDLLSELARSKPEPDA